MRLLLSVGNVVSRIPSVKNAIQICALLQQKSLHNNSAAVDQLNRPLLANWTRMSRQQRSASWWSLDRQRPQATVVTSTKFACSLKKGYNMLNFFGEFTIYNMSVVSCEWMRVCENRSRQIYVPLMFFQQHDFITLRFKVYLRSNGKIQIHTPNKKHSQFFNLKSKPDINGKYLIHQWQG